MTDKPPPERQTSEKKKLQKIAGQGANVLGNLLGLKNSVLIGIVAAICLGAGYAGGFLSGKLSATQQYANKVLAHQQKVIRVREIERTERVERDIVRESQMQQRITNLQTQTGNLQRLLYEKPDPDPMVFLRVGDLRMLDDAAVGDFSASGGTPGSARLAAYQEQTPSDISLRRLVSGEIDNRRQYRELATRCDELIDWVNDELIKRPLEAAKRADNVSKETQQ